MALAVLTGLAGLTGLIVARLLARLRRGWVLVTVEGRSMMPTLRPGDRVLVRRIPPSDIQVGQVVVVENPTDGDWRTPPLATRAALPSGRRWIVKRAVAGPGDPVPAEALDAIAGGWLPDAGGVLRVPPDHFVLLGDNRDVSVDSRAFGFVPDVRILGLAARPVERGSVDGGLAGRTRR